MSSNDQKEDLARQQEELRKYCKEQGYNNIEEIREIGSGLNYKKRGFLKLLRLLLCGKVERLVISYKDRLIRFGMEIIEEICRMEKIAIVVINRKEEMSFEEQLTEDLISILTVFTSKIYGKRSHERRKKT